MQWAHVTQMEGAMGRQPAPSAPVRSDGSGPRNSLGPNTAVVVKAWPLVVTAFSVIAFAVGLTWKVASELNTITSNAAADRSRILILETSVATKGDVQSTVQAAGEASYRRMRKMLGRGVIQCDRFGGASTCKILFPADEGD